MGVHSGPVNRVTDVNDKTNIAGSGINVAQRVMDCGDAGHILLSAHVAEDLAEYRHWQTHLHDLGECEVKYGLRLHLFNLHKRTVSAIRKSPRNSGEVEGDPRPPLESVQLVLPVGPRLQ